MKNIVKRCISAALAAASVLAATAPSAMADEERKLPSGISFDEIESKFDKTMKNGEDHYAGYEAVVFCGDEILYEGYFGDTDRENDIRCSEDSVMEWGSISKTFIWVSAMQLWEQGKLDLDADIRGYLPDGFLKHTRYDDPITMMNLMDHTGGWCEVTYSIATPDEDKITSLAEALQDTEPAQIDPPGEVVTYSNWGAALAAYVVECISGMDYTDYVHKNIFEPLGMEHTSIAPDRSDNEWVRSQRDLLRSYTYNLMGYKSQGKSISYIKLYPAGAATGTIRDLAAFAQALVSDDAPLFQNKETQDKMFTGTMFYGDTDIPISAHGFFFEEYKTRTVGHNGATIACHSNMLIDRESKVGLVTLTNETSVNQIIDGIPAMIFGRPDYNSFSDGRDEKKTLEGYFLPTRSQRSGVLRFTGLFQPYDARNIPDLIALRDGFYVLEGSIGLVCDSKRSSGTESYIIGSMEIDKDNAYPVELSLLALYYMAAIGAVFVLLFKFKSARKGRYHATAVGTVLTAGQIVKILSVASTFVISAYIGRDSTYGLPKSIGVTAGVVNIICICGCVLAAAAAVAGIVRLAA